MKPGTRSSFTQTDLFFKWDTWKIWRQWGSGSARTRVETLPIYWCLVTLITHFSQGTTSPARPEMLHNQGAGAHFSPLAASVREHTRGLGKDRERKKKKRRGQFVHPEHFSLAGTCQPYEPNAGREIQSSPGCSATAGPPGQLRGVLQGNLSTQ